jgi:AraC-like DNA-binding protein
MLKTWCETEMRENDILSSDLLYIWSSVSDKAGQDKHCHAEYEIYYFIQGDVEYQIEGRLYNLAPESLLLIPPNCFHGVVVKSSDLHRRVSIHFRPDLLDETERPLLLDIFHTERIYYPNLYKSHIGLLIQSLLDCKKMKKPLRELALKYRIISLLTYIYQIQSQNMTSSASADERIQSILWYLNGHIKENISLKNIVNRFHISKNHLNVLFRQETGTTINQYIKVKRLALARQEMRNGCGAEEAAYKAGFNDYSNFYRAYKSVFGIMPSNRTDNWQELRLV